MYCSPTAIIHPLRSRRVHRAFPNKLTRASPGSVCRPSAQQVTINASGSCSGQLVASTIPASSPHPSRPSRNEQRKHGDRSAQGSRGFVVVVRVREISFRESNKRVLLVPFELLRMQSHSVNSILGAIFVQCRSRLTNVPAAYISNVFLIQPPPHPHKHVKNVFYPRK